VRRCVERGCERAYSDGRAANRWGYEES
jgi:hypothetical protein